MSINTLNLISFFNSDTRMPDSFKVNLSRFHIHLMQQSRKTSILCGRNIKGLRRCLACGSAKILQKLCMILRRTRELRRLSEGPKAGAAFASRSSCGNVPVHTKAIAGKTNETKPLNFHCMSGNGQRSAARREPHGPGRKASQQQTAKERA